MNAPSLIAVFLALVSADYGTKRLAENAIPPEGTDVFGNFVRLRHQMNEGIAFSAPITGWPLKILTVALIAYVAYYYLREEKLRGTKMVDLAYAAFLAGAAGNGVDRILMGKVTDFIEVKYFANFNLADIIICASAATIVVIHFLHERPRNSK